MRHYEYIKKLNSLSKSFYETNKEFNNFSSSMNIFKNQYNNIIEKTIKYSNTKNNRFIKDIISSNNDIIRRFEKFRKDNTIVEIHSKTLNFKISVNQKFKSNYNLYKKARVIL